MVTLGNRKKLAVLTLALLAGFMVLSPAAFAQDEHAAEAVAGTYTMAEAVRVLGLAIGSALAISLTAIATARVQAAVGAGGTGALAEKPDLFGLILVLIAIPETLVIFGF